MTIRVAQAPTTRTQGDELLNAVAGGGTGVAAGSGVPRRGASRSGLRPAAATADGIKMDCVSERKQWCLRTSMLQTRVAHPCYRQHLCSATLQQATCLASFEYIIAIPTPLAIPTVASHADGCAVQGQRSVHRHGGCTPT
eukprot:scaffold62199_cov52-Phaeocystis_antarctica.AAC.1